MSAEQAYGESGYSQDLQINNVVTIRPPAVSYHTHPDLLVPLFTQKRTAFKAFAARDLGFCTVPCAKLGVAGFSKLVNTVVAGGATAKVTDSSNKDDKNRVVSTSLSGKSGKAAKDKDSMTHDKTR